MNIRLKETAPKLRKELSSVQRKATLQIFIGSLFGLAMMPALYSAMALPATPEAIPIAVALVCVSFVATGLFGAGAIKSFETAFKNVKKRRKIIESAEQRGLTVAGHVFKYIK